MTLDNNLKVLLNIKGRVQGVGYRMFVENEAIKYNLSGWVQNEKDGSVSCEACGSEKKLLEFIERLKAGPSLSRVDDIAATWGKQEGRMNNGFSIRY